MSMQTTITSKGQVTLPKALRERLGLGPGDKIEFLFDAQGEVRLLAIKQHVTKLKGMAPRPDRPLSLDEIDQAISDSAIEQ